MTLTTTATELSRLMRCIGSRLMPAAVPQESNKEQRDEGNAAHWLAERCFKGDAVVNAGHVAPNGYVITQEMGEHVLSYVGALDPGEMEADTSYSGDGWEVRGRADHLVYRDNTLTIDDFKYGWRIVEPAHNWTLISHAIGWCIRNNRRADRFVFRIHQPRPFHSEGPLREWSCSYEELMGFYHQIAWRLSNPTDELVTGLEQCAKCHALANCPAARRATMNAIDAAMLAFDETLPKPVLTHELETLRLAKGMIEARHDALEELITYRIKSGEVFDGYMLERKQGHRRWKSGLSGKALSMVCGVDLTKDDMVTPAEAKRRGVPDTVIEKLVDRPMLDAKLKAVDADAKARRVFGTGATR